MFNDVILIFFFIIFGIFQIRRHFMINKCLDFTLQCHVPCKKNNKFAKIHVLVFKFMKSIALFHRRLRDIQSQLERIYANGQVQNGTETYNMEPELTELMATSRDPERLAVLWREWRAETGKKMSDLYKDMVTLMNDGARHNGIMFTLRTLLLNVVSKRDFRNISSL